MSFFPNASNVSSFTTLAQYDNSVTNGMFAPFILLAFFVVAYATIGLDTTRRFAFASFITFILSTFLSFAVNVLEQKWAFLTLILTLASAFLLYFENTRQRG